MACQRLRGRVALLAPLVAFAVTGCSRLPEPIYFARTPSPAAVAPERFSDLRSSVDFAVAPAEDFYLYANGEWLRSHPLGPDQLSLTRFGLESQVDWHRELAGWEAGGPTSAAKRRLLEFYRSGMNTEKVEDLGLAPLQESLEQIATAATPAQFATLLADLEFRGVRPCFRVSTTRDLAGPGMLLEIHQAEFSLGDPAAYTSNTAPARSLRSAYLEYLVALLSLLGDPPELAGANAAAALAVETRLAGASLAPADLRDPGRTFHVVTFDQLRRLVPDFDWDAYFQRLGVAKPERLSLTSLETPRAFSRELEADPDQLRAYLRCSLIRDMVEVLPRPFLQARANFQAAALGGRAELPTREQLVFGMLEKHMGMTMGRVYRERFPLEPAAREQAEQIVVAVKKAMLAELEGQGWTEAERIRGRAKISALSVNLGYPDPWPADETFPILADAWAANVMAANRARLRDRLDRLQHPGRVAWPFPPQTSNAHYSATENRLTLPAGLLRPPFFSSHYDAARNYGALGVIVGHEISHAFDDVGRQFDEKGRLLANRSPAGDLVSGESYADRLGLRVAYRAFQASGSPVSLEGFTPEQRFFLSFGQMWATNMRPELRQKKAAVDPHPSPRDRVNDAVAGWEPFSEAFAPPNTPKR